MSWKTVSGLSFIRPMDKLLDSETRLLVAGRQNEPENERIRWLVLSSVGINPK